MTPLPESEADIEARQTATRFGTLLLMLGLGGLAALVWLLFAFLQAPLEAPFMAALRDELHQGFSGAIGDEPSLQTAALYGGILLYLFALGLGLRMATALLASGAELLRGNDLKPLLEALKRRGAP